MDDVGGECAVYMMAGTPPNAFRNKPFRTDWADLSAAKP
jgi:hypothetical protein